jgi:hypothetical protein
VSISATAKWILLALAGVAIAIGVAIAAANLTSQQIGIANESVSAGDALAPSLQVPAEAKPRGEGHDHGFEEETPPTAPPPTTTTEEVPPPSGESTEPSGPAEGGEDHGGHGSDGDD